jgi:hypothetical protein
MWLKRCRRRADKGFNDRLKKLKNNIGTKQESQYIAKIRLLEPIPYPWTKEYHARQFKFHKDQRGYFCTVEGEKIYFPERYAVDATSSEQLCALMIEQDKRSPHQYFSENVQVNEGDVVFDIGAAEGLITLLNIKKIKKAYLFECDSEWIDELRKTFEPYANKVEIINKFVAGTNDETHTTLDAYIDKHKEDSILLKMDIEGMETEVLHQGLVKNMGAANLKFACCTYNKEDDADVMEKIFTEYGYHTEFSDGYILFGENPSFRKGIIRAWK